MAITSQRFVWPQFHHSRTALNCELSISLLQNKSSGRRSLRSCASGRTRLTSRFSSALIWLECPSRRRLVPRPQSLSPYVTVAKLRLPQQDIGGQDNLEQMDKTSMSAWRVTEQHRPLGSIMRSRKEAYKQSSILRHRENHQERKEPKNLAEVFGAQMVAAGSPRQ